MSIVDLLEAFDEQKHPRGFAGRWARKLGKVADIGHPHPIGRPHGPEPRSTEIRVRPGPRVAGQLVPRNVVPGNRPRANRPKSDVQRQYEGGVVRMSPATRERLRNVFTPRERAAAKGRQPSAKIDELYSVAGKHQSHFEHILDRGRGIAHRLGAHVQETGSPASLKKAVADVRANPDRPHVIIAALKGRERAGSKVARKYGGDATRLTDLVRGTVLVPHVDDLPKAIEAIRAELPKGWTIVAPENRFAHEPGDHVNTGSKGGYRDIALLLRSPQGFHTELQVNTTHMWLAKDGGPGHRMYERTREIRETASAEHRPLTDRELAEVRNLDRKARELYDRALLKSSRARRAPVIP